MIWIKRRRTRRAITFVELLVSALLMSIGVMGLVGTWAFSYRVTENTDNVGMAYNVGRMVLEQVKLQGFAAPEGSQSYYFTGNAAGCKSYDAVCRYVVTSLITSDAVTSGTPGQAGAVPAQNALRTVQLTVRRKDNNATLWTTQTRLVRAGI